MKKRAIVTLIACVMTTAMLCGCGDSADTGAAVESDTSAAENEDEQESATDTEDGQEPEADMGDGQEPAAESEDTQERAVSTDGVKDPFGYEYVGQDVSAELTMYRYYADSDKDNMDYAIARMQEKYPGVSFTIEHRTDSDGSTLRTWAAVGELPDIFEINAADVYQSLKDDGSLYVVDAAVKNTGFYDLFSNGAAAQEARTADDGHQYGFGCEVSNLGQLWYNKELFQELGISEPTNFEEFKGCITALKEAGKVPVALFGAEKWPATSIYSLACIAEGQAQGLDAVNDGTASITEEAYRKGADKFAEIANLGAFGKGALSTNYQQAYEMMYSGEAGFFFSGAWFFLTVESDGMGDKIDYCNYNVFADDDVKEEVRWNALGGAQTEMKYSVNTEPPCGLDPETVTYLGLEFEYWTRVAAGVAGNMTTVIGDFSFNGSEGYKDYYDNYGNYKTFTNFTGDLSNGEFVVTADNACEMVVSGNYTTGEELVEDIAGGGY